MIQKNSKNEGQDGSHHERLFISIYRSAGII